MFYFSQQLLLFVMTLFVLLRRPDKCDKTDATDQINIYMSPSKYSRWQIDDIFSYFPENRIWHFMQIASIGDKFLEMSKPVFWEK